MDNTDRWLRLRSVAVDENDVYWKNRLLKRGNSAPPSIAMAMLGVYERRQRSVFLGGTWELEQCSLTLAPREMVVVVVVFLVVMVMAAVWFRR